MQASDRATPFVIFATQRTGSNWLMGMLDAHPAIAAYDELLLAGTSGSGYWGRTDFELFEPYFVRNRRRDSRAQRAIWSLRYLNQFYSRQVGAAAIGMKLMYDQLWKSPWVWLYMLRNRVHVVHLVRANLFDIVLSVETVKARNRPHAWKDHVVEDAAVRLDPEMLVPTLRTLEFRVRVARLLLSVLPVRSLEVSYEQLTADPSLIDRVLTFLGVTPAPDVPELVSRFKKLNTSGREALIENYPDVERALEGTRYASFLSD
jgi:LPS sulfotransferase NodH